MPGHPTYQIRQFANSPEGRNVILQALEETIRSMNKAREDLSDLNDASSHGTPAERVLLRTRLQEHIANLRTSIDNFETALSPASNASMGFGS